MLTRRNWILSVAAGFVALAVAVLPVLAAKLVGVITSDDPAKMKIIVNEQGTDKDYEITVTENTVYTKATGEEYKKKPDLAKLKKGRGLTVTHEDFVASKIALEKAEPKKKNETTDRFERRGDSCALQP